MGRIGLSGHGTHPRSNQTRLLVWEWGAEAKVALSTWAPSRSGRKRWTWQHPEADHECKKLKKQDPWAYGQLGRELERLTAQSGGRPGRPAKGRIRQSSAPTGSTSLAVLFVERRDKPGLGGLLLHRCGTTVNAPPEGAYESARHRLSAMAGW
jgi:hypothetical protein